MPKSCRAPNAVGPKGAYGMRVWVTKVGTSTDNDKSSTWVLQLVEINSKSVVDDDCVC